jgi:transposase
MTLNDLYDLLLPPSTPLWTESIDAQEPGLILKLAVTEPQAVCPDCLQPTFRVHGRYWRTLADLPWATTPVRLRLHVRRFWCETPSCERQTFTERLSELAPHYARTTARLHHIQTDIGLALGGTAGARRLANQGMPGSRHTLLRRVRRYAPPGAPPAAVIGIDDWAKRKGHTYGTIVVDLDRHRPVDVLPDRRAETVAAWMQVHPEVHVVARDRAEAYASGVRQGAPQAMPVADRWHLLKNLREAVEEEFSLRPTLPWCPPIEASAAVLPASPSHPGPVQPVPIYSNTPSGRRAEAARQRRRNQRLEQYEQACKLKQQGLPQPMIAHQVGVSKRTLTRWCKAGTFPERQRRHGDRHSLSPYKPRQNIVYLSAELNRLCRIRVSTYISIRDLSPVGGLILPLYSVVAHRNDTSRVQSIKFRTSVKDLLARFVALYHVCPTALGRGLSKRHASLA